MLGLVTCYIDAITAKIRTNLTPLLTMKNRFSTIGRYITRKSSRIRSNFMQKRQRGAITVTFADYGLSSSSTIFRPISQIYHSPLQMGTIDQSVHFVNTRGKICRNIYKQSTWRHSKIQIPNH